MNSKDILKNYIKFFENKGHKLVPNVSLVPENDPTLLFVNSGMFPLVPYLEGEPHPLGKRLVNVQRCIRFEDIDDIGDNRHTVGFHMIGNWSLGDYFKEEQLNWKFEFFIEELGLDPSKIYATIFPGDEEKGIEKDEEAVEILKGIFSKYGIEAKEGERIFASKEDNWWQRGDAVGELGGPSSEIFYYIGENGNGFGKNILDHEEEFIEIGNSVFMQYKKYEDGWKPLSQKNIDFGGGFERITMCVQQKHDIFETDNFWPIIQNIEKLSGKNYGDSEQTTKSMRIIADHMRSATFLAMDGVIPSNKDQGYVLRKLIRRMVRAGHYLGIPTEEDISANLVDVVTEMFSWMYPQLNGLNENIKHIFSEEENKFEIILNKGAKNVRAELEGYVGSEKDLAEIAFNYYQSGGYPREFFVEDARDLSVSFDEKKFNGIYNEKLEKHKNESRAGAEQKFKGGLADHSENTVAYHTTTHLLHWALRQVLGNEVEQRGSNITGERLRFDFAYPERLTDEELNEVVEMVNEKILQKLPVNFEIMPKEEALKLGAQAIFGEKYGEKVKVYYIGETLDSAFSKEFCGGPHVENLAELKPIEIYKQKSIGKGTMRIYARWK